jgi:hypothetical protein
MTEFRVSRFSVTRTRKVVEYATDAYVRESLQTLKASYGLPVFEAIEFLETGNVDSVSLNKEEPYVNFHAMRFDDKIKVSIRDATRDVELELRVSPLKKLKESARARLAKTH